MYEELTHFLIITVVLNSRVSCLRFVHSPIPAEQKQYEAETQLRRVEADTRDEVESNLETRVHRCQVDPLIPSWDYSLACLCAIGNLKGPFYIGAMRRRNGEAISVGCTQKGSDRKLTCETGAKTMIMMMMRL